MRGYRAIAALLLALPVLAGCVTDERQWMKLNERYTIEDFQRDAQTCSKSGQLDDVCMRDRGWVAVNPGTKTETAKDPLARDIGRPVPRR
jgi:hypothetical protein